MEQEARKKDKKRKKKRKRKKKVKTVEIHEDTREQAVLPTAGDHMQAAMLLGVGAAFGREHRAKEFVKKADRRASIAIRQEDEMFQIRFGKDMAEIRKARAARLAQRKAEVKRRASVSLPKLKEPIVYVKEAIWATLYGREKCERYLDDHFEYLVDKPEQHLVQSVELVYKGKMEDSDVSPRTRKKNIYHTIEGTWRFANVMVSYQWGDLQKNLAMAIKAYSLIKESFRKNRKSFTYAAISNALSEAERARERLVLDDHLRDANEPHHSNFHLSREHDSDDEFSYDWRHAMRTREWDADASGDVAEKQKELERRQSVDKGQGKDGSKDDEKKAPADDAEPEQQPTLVVTVTPDSTDNGNSDAKGPDDNGQDDHGGAVTPPLSTVAEDNEEEAEDAAAEQEEEEEEEDEEQLDREIERLALEVKEEPDDDYEYSEIKVPEPLPTPSPSAADDSTGAADEKKTDDTDDEQERLIPNPNELGSPSHPNEDKLSPVAIVPIPTPAAPPASAENDNNNSNKQEDPARAVPDVKDLLANNSTAPPGGGLTPMTPMTIPKPLEQTNLEFLQSMETQQDEPDRKIEPGSPPPPPQQQQQQQGIAPMMDLDFQPPKRKSKRPKKKRIETPEERALRKAKRAEETPEERALRKAKKRERRRRRKKEDE